MRLSSISSFATAEDEPTFHDDDHDEGDGILIVDAEEYHPKQSNDDGIQHGLSTTSQLPSSPKLDPKSMSPMKFRMNRNQSSGSVKSMKSQSSAKKIQDPPARERPPVS